MEQFLLPLTDDIRRSLNIPEANSRVKNKLLIKMWLIIESENANYQDTRLPYPDWSMEEAEAVPDLPPLLAQHHLNETQMEALAEDVASRRATLLPQQEEVFSQVTDAVAHHLPSVFSLSACGGSGKTYVLNLILDHVRSQGYTALAAASSGIAAGLLHKGRTMHTTFGLPLNMDDQSTSALSKQSPAAKLIARCALVVMDEITMASKEWFLTIDRCMRDFKNDPETPFGGATVVLAGDWRQCLPVMPKSERPEVVAAIAKNAPFWAQTIKLSLTLNMRAELAKRAGPAADSERDQVISEYADHLLQVGDGRVPRLPGYGEYTIRLREDLFSKEMVEPEALDARAERCRRPIEGPAHLRYVTSIKSLVSFVYGDINQALSRGDWLCERAIITGKNTSVDSINSQVMADFPGQMVTLLGSTVCKEDDATQFPVELLEMMQYPGVPPHRLKIKVGAPVMLMRNLQASKGHVNGARYIVEGITRNLLHLRKATGENRGQMYLLPRINFEVPETSCPIRVLRRQFPVKPAFAMTVNKSQGQTFKKVGIYLPSSLFAHGQLYVALSRCGSPEDVRVVTVNGNIRGQEGQYTNNVVYPEVLMD